MAKLRPMSKLTNELEKILSEMVDSHGLQTGEIDDLVHGYMEKHYPGNKEPYEDGTLPFRYYGHIDGLIGFAEGLKNVKKLR